MKRNSILRIVALTMTLGVAQTGLAADSRKAEADAPVGADTKSGNQDAKLQSGAATGTQTETAGAPEPETIVITGSRLTQMSSDSVIPIKQIDQAEAIESGHMDLVETLRDVPGVGGNDSLTTNQGSIQGNGLSTISLRGLGLARTLVLIDGRRTVSNAGNRNVVSVSTIPQYMIDRIEVTTGGASAVYGSDAIAGVVNIITPERMDGFKARVVGRDTHDGGGGSIEYSVGAGSRFMDDRLYVMGALTYSEQRALYARDRDWAMTSASYSATSNTLTSPHLTSNPSGGRFAGNTFYYDEDGLQEGFVTSVNGYDVRQAGFLITPRQMLNVGGKLSFDVSDDLQFFGQVMYSAVDTQMSFEAVTAAYSTTYGVNDEFEVARIPRYSAYTPAAISARVGSAGVTWFRRFNELGDREFDNQRVTWRAAAGFKGTLFDDAWDWNLTYGFGDFDGHQISKNYLNLRNLSHGINTITVNSEVVCADPVARAEGCVPVNLFGVGSISSEAADYIRSDKDFRARNRQHTLEASIVGSLFSLPAGDVQTAFGVEWRRDETSSRTDDLTQEAISSGPFIPNFDGKISTRAAYAEARLPLLRDLPMIQDLNLELALRVTDYPELDNVGTTLSYRGGVQWSPISRLMVRAAYGSAQRAPYTTELFSPPRDGYSTVVDLCHDITAATPGLVAENCRLDPGISAAITQDGRFTQDNTRVFTPASGNLGLKEETAKTLTAGIVFSPWSKMEASIDYYDIKIDDAIASINNASLLIECYSDTDGIGNKFCSPIQRNAEGQIIRIDNQLQNLNSTRASGIDVAFNQRFSLRGIGIPGQFTLDGSYTRRTRLETVFDGATGVAVTDSIGQVGTFKNEAKMGLAWSRSPVRVKWTTVYLGEAVDSNARKELFANAGITDPLFLNVPSFIRHDLNMSFFPITMGDAKWRVFANVQNLFNRYGPYLPSGTESGGNYNYNSAYGVSGRTYSLGVEIRL